MNVNLSLACGNRPPSEAFPQLPVRPPVPDMVDPDAWLTHYHRRLFRRRVDEDPVRTITDVVNIPGGFRRPAQVFQVLQGGKLLCEREIQVCSGSRMPFQRS